MANRSQSVSRSITYADLVGEQYSGNVIYVDARTKSAVRDGVSFDSAWATIGAALEQAVAHDTILVAPGVYDEAVVIARAKSNIRILGVGGLGSSQIAPTTTNASAVTCEADDVTLENLACDADGTGSGLINRGSRLRAFGCKFLGGAVGVKATLGTSAQVTATTHGVGALCLFQDCEISNNTKGVEIIATDQGSVDNLRFVGCLFHDNSAADFEESAGTISDRFAALEISSCRFQRLLAGTEPTAYILLNDDNGNKGVVSGCSFPSALAGGKNLVSTGLIWTANFHTGGLSTGQPS